RAGAWGIGCGIGLGLVASFFIYFQTRPKRWQTDVLEVKHVKAEGIDQMDENLKVKSVGVTFDAELENNSGHDITLYKDTRVMQENKEGASLHGSFLALDKDYFLPAGHTTRVSLDNSDLCAASEPEENCFKTYFGDQSKVLLFDEK